MNPLRICIVGLKCYDHLAGVDTPRYLGGIETQLAILAKGLVQQGCQVSLITFDHGQAEGEVFDGVTALKAYPPDGGLRVVRNLHPRSTRLWKAMRRADADVYLQMGAGLETAMTAFGAGLIRGRRAEFVYCMASDRNFGADYHSGCLGWEGKLYRYGLRKAAMIVAQTKKQQDGLMDTIGLATEIIPMAVEAPSEILNPAARTPKSLLWVGRTIPTKRIELLLDVARRMPSVSIELVGAANRTSSYAQKVLQGADQLPNVQVHGRLSCSELRELYRTSQILCCTSEVEGFPTTFLEAWANGMPVVTTIDPDGVVESNGLGRVVDDVDGIVQSVQELLDDCVVYEQIHRRAIDYHRQNHSVEVIASSFKSSFEPLGKL